MSGKIFFPYSLSKGYVQEPVQGSCKVSKFVDNEHSKKGQVVRKLVNVNPGLNVNPARHYFLLFNNVFTSNVWCSLGLLQLKTKEQTI